MSARIFILGTLWLALASLVSLTGCSSPKEQYEHGYADGVRDAKPKGFKEGYDSGYREAFEQAHPGTPFKQSGIYRAFYRAMIWAGAIKIIICLLLALFGFYVNSESAGERFGKVFLTIFGGVLTLTLTMFFGLSETVIDALLEPAPKVLSFHLLLLVVAAAGMYIFFEIFFRVFRSKHRPIVQAWLMALISALLSLLIPALALFWNSVPDVTGYLGANILAGSLLGSLYWIGDAALRHRITAPPHNNVIG